MDNKFIYNKELQFVTAFSWMTKFVVFLYIVGFFQSKPMRIMELNFIVKILIATFLIYRFNKYRKNKIEFTELDRKVVFSSGVFILVLSFADILDGYVTEIRSVIFPYTEKFITAFQNLIR